MILFSQTYCYHYNVSFQLNEQRTYTYDGTLTTDKRIDKKSYPQIKDEIQKNYNIGDDYKTTINSLTLL